MIIPSRGLWIGETKRKEFINTVHNKFVNTLIRNKIKVIDIKPFLEINNEPLSYFFKTDGHFNEKGNILLAEKIANNLIRQFQDASLNMKNIINMN